MKITEMLSLGITVLGALIVLFGAIKKNTGMGLSGILIFGAGIVGVYYVIEKKAQKKEERT